MNIIIPVIDDNSGKFNMAKGFHTTEDVCVYNTLNSNYQWVKIKEISQCEENLSLSLKRKGIYTVITSQMPFLALGLFKESGLMVYKSKGKNLEENIDLFLKNELDTFSPQIQFKASSCSSSCSSCDTSCN